MAASLLPTKDTDWTDLYSAPATKLPKSSLSVVPSTGRTQTAYCIGLAIRCMMNGQQFFNSYERRDRRALRLAISPLSGSARDIIFRTAGLAWITWRSMSG